MTGGRQPGPAAGPGGPPASASSESAGHTHPPAVTTESRSSCQCAIRRRRSRRLIPGCRPGLSVAHPCQYRRPGLSILTRTRSARPLGRAHSVPGRTHSPPRRSGSVPAAAFNEIQESNATIRRPIVHLRPSRASSSQVGSELELEGHGHGQPEHHRGAASGGHGGPGRKTRITG